MLHKKNLNEHNLLTRWCPMVSDVVAQELFHYFEGILGNGYFRQLYEPHRLYRHHSRNKMTYWLISLTILAVKQEESNKESRHKALRQPCGCWMNMGFRFWTAVAEDFPAFSKVHFVASTVIFTLNIV